MLICTTTKNRTGQEIPCCRPADQDCQQCRIPARHGLKWNSTRVRWERTHPLELHREAAARMCREAQADRYDTHETEEEAKTHG